jgi:uncharacterized membrane protein YphA (DoxX/SURF4 family)
MDAPVTKPTTPGKALYWTGWVLSVLPSLMLLFSAVMKFTNSKQLNEGMQHLGWQPEHAVGLGITELTCTILYLIPQTSMLGAILLTGYLGGAIATHARLGEPFYFQAALGVVIWLGLFLREPRLWPLVPWRK